MNEWDERARCGHDFWLLPRSAEECRDWCRKRPDLARADADKIMEAIAILTEAMETLRAKEAA